MKIYISHSGKYDYVSKIYNSIKNSDLSNRNTFFFPHDDANKTVNTKDIIAEYDLVIAEVSQPSIGQGIELGRADYAGTPILCIFEKDMKVSSSLQFVAQNFIEYENQQDMINKLENYLEEIKNSI